MPILFLCKLLRFISSFHFSLQKNEANIFTTIFGKKSGLLGTVSTQSNILLVCTSPYIHPGLNSIKFKIKRSNTEEKTVKFFSIYAFISSDSSKHFLLTLSKAMKRGKSVLIKFLLEISLLPGNIKTLNCSLPFTLLRFSKGQFNRHDQKLQLHGSSGN